MTLMADILNELLSMSAVTALVGTGADARIRPDLMDESDDLTLQHILIEIDDETPQNSLDGLGGLVYASVVVSCRALELQDATALAEAVRLNGTDPGTGLAGLSAANFEAVLNDQTTSLTLFDDGSQNGWRDVTQNYTISHAEVV